MPRTWAAAAYDGSVRHALLAHKEQGRVAIAPVLGAALTRSVLAACDELVGKRRDISLVPVPSAPSAVRRRGGDPLLRLARLAAAGARTEQVSVRLAPALRLTRRLDDQARLDTAARAANLLRAHAVDSRWAALLRDTHVVLLDDVVTTGATLVEAARALRLAGVTEVTGAVVAATQRRHLTAKRSNDLNEEVPVRARHA